MQRITTNLQTKVQHQLIGGPKSEEQGIIINDSKVLSKKSSICIIQEIDRDSELLGFGVPEMYFGNNGVYIKFNSKVSVNFNTLEALKLVLKGQNSNTVKVSYANDWIQERQEWEESKQESEPFDWTFTTKYQGQLELSEGVELVDNSTEKLDLEPLKRPEPILFYTDNILFEDELGDNGTSLLNIKVRVMASGIFVLQRFFLRVDDVLFRIYDTRYYYNFNNQFIFKEFSQRERPYKDVQQAMERFSGGQQYDPSLVNDPNFVYKIMTELDSKPNLETTSKIVW